MNAPARPLFGAVSKGAQLRLPEAALLGGSETERLRLREEILELRQELERQRALSGILVLTAEREQRELQQAQVGLASRMRCLVRAAEERSKLNDILQNVPVVIWELRLEPATGMLRPEYVNDYVESVIGYSKEELLTQPRLWEERVHEADRVKVKSEIEASLAGRAMGPVQFRWIHRDGEVVWIESSKLPFVDEDGKPAGVRGMAVDITARKLAEGEREESEQRFHVFMDHSPVVALIKDDEGRFVYGNRVFKRWCESLGYQWDGATDHDLFPAEVAARHCRLDEEALGGNKTTEVLETMSDQEGRIHYWTVLRFPIHARGKRYLGLVAIDNTDRRRMEKELLEISDTEHRKLGQELHDGLCQHLLGVALMSRTLAKRMKQKNLPESADVKTISGFLEDALNVTRGLMQGFNLVNVEGPGGLYSALQGFCQTTSRLFGKECQVTSTVEIRSHESGAATHLFRIAQEATHNAIKHGLANRVTISLNRDRDVVILAVENDGDPLPENFRQSPGMGMRTMNYRASLIGAELHFENLREGGVVVTCRIPTGSDKGMKVLI